MQIQGEDFFIEELKKMKEYKISTLSWMLCCWLCVALPATSFADPILTFDLSNPAFDYAGGGKALEMDVRLRLTSDNPADEVDFVQISLTASDAFISYSFALDPSRTNWLVDTDTLNSSSTMFATTPNDWQLPSTPIKADGVFRTLGRLRVDFANIVTDTASLSIVGAGEPNETTGLGIFDGVPKDISREYSGGLQFFINGELGDKFRFSTTAVPEPSSLAIATMFWVGMVFRRKRKQFA